MGTVDQPGGRRGRHLLAALAVAGVALIALLVTLRGFNAADHGPVGEAPVTSVPTTGSAAPTERPPQGTATGPTAPPASSQPPTSREQYEQAARRELEQGLVAYNPPAQARVQQDFELTVRVQRGTATVSPSLTALPGTPSVIVERLPVGTYMRAELRGAGFDVQPLSDELQLIDGVTEWAWRVTPQADGLQTLRLTLVVVLNDLPLSNRTFDRSINVAVKKQPPWYQRATGLLDVPGVITALAIAGILGSLKLARTKWRPRKPADKSPPPPQKQPLP